MPDKKVAEDKWIVENLELDKTIPFLGENTPKSVGFLTKGGDKVLVWHPGRPLILVKGVWKRQMLPGFRFLCVVLFCL